MRFLQIQTDDWKFEIHFTFWKNQGLGFAWYPFNNNGGIMFLLWAIIFRFEEGLGRSQPETPIGTYDKNSSEKKGSA